MTENQFFYKTYNEIAEEKPILRHFNDDYFIIKFSLIKTQPIHFALVSKSSRNFDRNFFKGFLKTTHNIQRVTLFIHNYRSIFIIGFTFKDGRSKHDALVDFREFYVPMERRSQIK